MNWHYIAIQYRYLISSHYSHVHDVHTFLRRLLLLRIFFEEFQFGCYARSLSNHGRNFNRILFLSTDLCVISNDDHLSAQKWSGCFQFNSSICINFNLLYYFWNFYRNTKWRSTTHLQPVWNHKFHLSTEIQYYKLELSWSTCDIHLVNYLFYLHTQQMNLKREREKTQTSITIIVVHVNEKLIGSKWNE